MNISNSVFMNNFATKKGGAIYSSGNKNVKITKTTFYSNTALSSGSDICLLNSNYYLYLFDSSFENTASVSALYMEASYLDV